MATKTMAARTAVPWVAEVCSSARQSSAAAVAVAAAGSVAEASAALEASAEAASAEAVPEARGKPVLFQTTRLTYRKDDIAKATKLRWNLSSLRFFWLNNVKTPGEYAHNSKNLCKFAIY